MATRTESFDAYVDTSALIAFADRSDTHHALFRRAFADPPRLATTVLVVAEGHAWFLKRYDRVKALGFLSMIEAMSPLRVLPVGARDLRTAAGFARRFSNQDLTLADACGLHAMAAHRIRSCWSTDFHLGLTGVSLLIHQR